MDKPKASRRNRKGIMHTFEVEMQGRLGYTVTVLVNADKIGQAEFIAAHRFPELMVTGNTRDAGPAK
jgi:hypothetical protein